MVGGYKGFPPKYILLVLPVSAASSGRLGTSGVLCPTGRNAVEVAAPPHCTGGPVRSYRTRRTERVVMVLRRVGWNLNGNVQSYAG